MSMFGLGNLFGGLGNLFTMPNLLQAMDFLGNGMDVYGQIDSLLKPPQMPDFPRLDQQGNQAQPVTPTMSPGDRARRFASARSQMAERGVYSGGAAENPLASAQGMSMFNPEELYSLMGQGAALPYEDDDPYGGYF